MNQANQAPQQHRPRSRYWDIVRGIGILSIVIGHCSPLLNRYAYAYHLILFFFVSGYLYNEAKYASDPFLHLAVKLKSSWPKYVGYMTFYVLLHNPFEALGINADGVHYNHTQTLAAISNTLVLWGNEPMGGPMWFVPFWVLSCGIFGGIVWASHRAANWWLALKWTVIVSGSALFGLAGAFLTIRGVPLVYQLHLVFLMQPFLAAGWALRQFDLACGARASATDVSSGQENKAFQLSDQKDTGSSFRGRLKVWIALPLALLLWYLAKPMDYIIDLSMGRIYGGWQLFLMAACGIYCCLYLGNLLDRTKAAGNLFCFWGQHTFDIMSAHFLVFKLIDVIYGRLILGDGKEIYSAFPQAYGGTLTLVYALLGTTLPALLAWGSERLIMRKQARKSNP